MSFVIDTTIEIAAPAAVVWEVISDLPRYRDWNPFCLECSSTLQPGDPIDMTVKLMAKPQRQREWMKEYIAGRRFAYAMKPVPGTLSSFRSHDVEALGAERTRYRSHFRMQGWLRILVLAIFREKLENGFAGMTAAIKVRSEKIWAERRAAGVR